MEQKRTVTDEILLYSVIFLTGLLIRTLLLGAFPLREYEAGFANQAWDLAQNAQLEVGNRVGYLFFTQSAFSLLGSSNLTARLFPVLAGSALVWVPYLLRDQLGKTPALIFAAGLALDPGLVSVSRFAGSPLPAAVFLVAGLLMLTRERYSWSIFLLGLSLFSGPDFWLGVLMLWVAAAFSLWLLPGDLMMFLRTQYHQFREQLSQENSLLLVVGLPLGFLVFISSFYLRHYQGITAWAGSLVDFLLGFNPTPGPRAGQLVLTLLFYQPLPLILGGIAGVRGWFKKDPRAQYLSLGVAAGLLILLLYPSRRTADLIWILIPLYGLAALELHRLFQRGIQGLIPWLQAGLILVLFILAWFSFTGMIVQADNSRAVLLQAGIILAAAALGGIATAIVAAEWSWDISRQGIWLGVGSALFIYGISALTGSAYLRPDDPREFWVPGPGTGQLSLLMETIQDVSLASTGRKDSIRGAVYLEDEVLHWQLRDYPAFEFYREYNADQRPPLFITGEDAAELVVSDAYLGQDFLHQVSPGWIGVLPSPWKNWAAFREGIVEEERVVLWVRKDVIPGADLYTSSADGANNSRGETE
ncbi:MAG: hypothetical protein U5K99_04605 [Anaerolineales bacterium]|nr:hypothetical protein [Anaerolineales bacterium]